MDADRLKKTVANLTKGVVSKSLRVKRNDAEHNSHRWIKTRKVCSVIQKMAGVGEPRYQGTLQKQLLIHELLRKEAGMGAPATVASTGFTPTFGGHPTRTMRHMVKRVQK